MRHRFALAIVLALSVYGALPVYVGSGFSRTAQADARLKPRATYEAPAGRVLVMPFENVTRDSRIFWLGEASAVLLADDLDALGTDATVIRIGQLVGATQVVVGSLEMEKDALVVRAPMPELFATFERVARRLAPMPANPAAEIDRQHPSIAAFEDYIKGLLADMPETAIGYLEAALKRQPTLDRARLALWDVYENQGDYEQALAAVQPVPADSPWARRARFLAGLSDLELKKYDDAFAAFKTLADARPTATVLNNLGVVQMRRGVTPRDGQAVYHFNKAAETDRDDPDYVFNLGYAYWSNRDPQAAIYWLRETVRLNPADGDAHYVLGAALAASGNTVEAAREKELARRLSSTYEQWEKRPAADAVPKGLERVKSDVELPHARRIETTLASGEQRDQPDLAVKDVEGARAEAERALAIDPASADAKRLLEKTR